MYKFKSYWRVIHEKFKRDSPCHGNHKQCRKKYEFFTYVLGLRLVKKTVNQDDIRTYHLFFADDKGNAGTDITFLTFRVFQRGRMEPMKFQEHHFVYQVMRL